MRNIKKVVIFTIVLMHSIAGYNQTTGTWLNKTDMPTVNGCSSSFCDAQQTIGFAIGDSIYCGSNASFYRYDRTTDSYISKASISYITNVMANCSINGKGYILAKDANSVPRMYEYNPVSNSWSPKQQFPGTARSAPAYFLINNKLYIISGTTALYNSNNLNDFSVNEVWEYNPIADVFLQKNNITFNGNLGILLPREPNKPRGFSIQNFGYVLWGTGSFYQYDPIVDIWYTKPAPNTYFGCASGAACLIYNAFSFQNLGYALVTDWASGGSNKVFLKYDPIIEQWSTIYNLVNPAGNQYFDRAIYATTWISNSRNVYGFYGENLYNSSSGRGFNCEWTPNNYLIYTSNITRPVSSCIGIGDNTNFQLQFTALGNYNTNNNVFYLQLSDANGSFTNPQNIDSIVTGTSTQYIGTFSPNLPPSIWNTSLNYKLRVVSTNPYSDDEFWTVVKNNVTIGPDTAVSLSGPTSFCPGSFVTIQASTGVGFTYRWYKNNILINGVTASSYSASSSGDYYCIITNSSSCTANTRTITVNANLSSSTPVISNSGSTTFCQGGSVTLTSSASGNQWYLNGTAITGAASNTFDVIQSGTYTVNSTQNCFTGTSNSIAVTVNALPSSVITAAGSTTFCSGSSVVLNANTGTGLTYQWKKDGVNINGATTSSYTASIAGSYAVVVTNSSNCNSTSSATQVTVNSTPSSPSLTASGSTTFCQGNNVTLTSSASSGNQWYKNGTAISGATASTYVATSTGSFTVVATLGTCSSSVSNITSVTVNALPSSVITAAGSTTFCSGSNVVLNANAGSGLTYQWKKDGVNISGATTSSYTANVTGSYTVVVTNSSNCSSTSSGTQVTVNSTPSTPSVTVSGSTTFCQGSSVTLTSSVSSGNQWYNNGTAISGATGSTYLATTSGTYTVVATLGTCSSSVSNITSVTVNALPSSVITAAGSTTFCSGSNVVLNANTGSGLTYQWKKDGVIISGVTISSYTANVTGSYTVVVTNSSNCSSTSSGTQVTVNSTPSTPSVTASGSTTFCQGNSVTLTSSASSGNQWYNNGTAISGATGSTYLVTTSGTYTVVATLGTCSSSVSNITPVTVNAVPSSVITSAGATTFCSGSNVVLNANAGSGLTYQWKKDGVDISGATTSSYTANVTGSYTVVVTNSSNCSSTSSATQVTVNSTPSTPSVTASGSTTFCQGSSVTLTSSVSSGNQWYNNGTAISGATGSTYLATTSGTYTVVATLGTCSSSVSNITSVTVNALPSSVITAAGSTTFCSGSNVVLNANTGSGLTYQWKKDGVDISGATTSIYTASITGSYTVVVTNGSSCSTTSSTSLVTVNTNPAIPDINWNGNQFSTTVIGVSYQWFLNSVAITGATSSTYTPNSIGNYQIQVSLNGCTNISNSYNLVVTGIDPNNIPSDYIAQIIPNPASNKVVVKFSETPASTLQIQIVNNVGAVLKTEKTKNNTTQIDISKLPSGTYFIKIIGGVYNQVKKLEIIK